MERWVYLPVSESRLYQVLSGDIPSRQALSNPEDGYLFVTDVEYSGEVRNVVLTDIESIPNDALPRPDARLNIALPEEIGRVAHRDRAHVVDITLQSEDQETGRVAARVFGSFVANFQRLFDALGQAKAGQASRYGPVSQSVLNRTKLGMIASYAGSFGVRFETQEQDDMFGESLARESLDALFGLLEAEDNLAGLTSHLRVLRGRVATNYQELLKTIEASIPSVSLNWTQPGRLPSRHAALSQEVARNIYVQIEAARETLDDPFDIQGTFNGGSIRTRRFEIDAIPSGVRYVGRMSREAVDQLSGEIPLGATCQARLQPRLEVSETTGEEKPTFELVAIALLGHLP